MSRGAAPSSVQEICGMGSSLNERIYNGIHPYPVSIFPREVSCLMAYWCNWYPYRRPRTLFRCEDYQKNGHVLRQNQSSPGLCQPLPSKKKTNEFSQSFSMILPLATVGKNYNIGTFYTTSIIHRDPSPSLQVPHCPGCLAYSWEGRQSDPARFLQAPLRSHKPSPLHSTFVDWLW